MLLTSTKAKIVTFSLLPIVLIIVGVAAFLLARGWPPAPATTASGGIPISPAIEEKWGIHVTQIGVTADGGMVDFRYIVLDPDKALVVQDEKNIPIMIAEDSGTTVNSVAPMGPNHNLIPGRTYFWLYRNTNGAIKRGDQVSVVIGDLKLEHVVAK